MFHAVYGEVHGCVEYGEQAVYCEDSAGAGKDGDVIKVDAEGDAVMGHPGLYRERPGFDAPRVLEEQRFILMECLYLSQANVHMTAWRFICW